MAIEKKMDESDFSEIVKEVTAVGEMIRTHQDEKQSVMNDFVREKDRYRKGKISKKALDSSAKKVNKELSKIDHAIRKDIRSLASVANQTKKFAAKQAPRTFRASVSGVSGSAGKKKHHRKHSSRRHHRSHHKKR